MSFLRLAIAVLFLVMAAGLLSRYATTRRPGLLVAAGTYGAAGALTLTLGTWWPLLAGAAVAWGLRALGADPPTDLRLDLPTIEREEVADPARVRDYLSWWLANDKHVRPVAFRFITEAWHRGLRRPETVPDDDSWTAPTPAEAWFLKTAADIVMLSAASRTQFVSHLDGIDALGVRTLMAAGEAMLKYDLPPTPPDFAAVRAAVRDEGEFRTYAKNYVADAVLSARLRVLAWTYQHWHGERYELVEKRQHLAPGGA